MKGRQWGNPVKFAVFRLHETLSSAGSARSRAKNPASTPWRSRRRQCRQAQTPPNSVLSGRYRRDSQSVKAQPAQSRPMLPFGLGFKNPAQNSTATANSDILENPPTLSFRRCARNIKASALRHKRQCFGGRTPASGNDHSGQSGPNASKLNIDGARTPFGQAILLLPNTAN